MNARIYDSEIGRFLSPDTIVQDPYDSQTYNRYSYVRNNPLLYTDPSGHNFVDDLKKGLKKVAGIAVTAFLAIHAPGIGSFGIGALGGAAGAAINGGNIWKGALMGGITAQAFRWAGHGTTSVDTTFSSGTLFKRHLGIGALSGGINSVINGGKFGQGFVSGGLSSGIAKGFGGNGVLNRAILGGIGGGIAYKIYGGSFSDGFDDGAIRGAMAYVFNDRLGNWGRKRRYRSGHRPELTSAERAEISKFQQRALDDLNIKLDDLNTSYNKWIDQYPAAKHTTRLLFRMSELHPNVRIVGFAKQVGAAFKYEGYARDTMNGNIEGIGWRVLKGQLPYVGKLLWDLNNFVRSRQPAGYVNKSDNSIPYGYGSGAMSLGDGRSLQR